MEALISNDMIIRFQNRTNFHIDKVSKYVMKIIDLNLKELDKNILNYESMHHDMSKFKEPEYYPYIHLTWKYYLQEERNEKYELSKDMIFLINLITFYHIKTNKHHPEFWDDAVSFDNNINKSDRDKVPSRVVNAESMPLSYVACMVADWLAMSEEKNTDPIVWLTKNINKRWKFNKYQLKLIYKLVDKLWFNTK